MDGLYMIVETVQTCLWKQNDRLCGGRLQALQTTSSCLLYYEAG